MMHIDHTIKESSLHGIGLFTGQDIKTGDLIHTPNTLLDINLTEEEFNSLSEKEQKEVMYYGYFDVYIQKYHVSFDPVRFLNHGAPGVANITQDEKMHITALHNISAGEELYLDYNEVYDQEHEHFGRILESTNA